MILLTIVLIMIQGLGFVLFEWLLELEVNYSKDYSILPLVITLVLEGIAYYYTLDLFFNIQFG